MPITQIASWGSSGSGKSTIALALAAQLAHRKHDVLLLSTDTKNPALPFYLPNSKLDSRHSIGGLLELDHLIEAHLKDKIHKHPKSDHLFCMGLASGEISTISYHAPERRNVQQLMQLISDYTPFEYVIVDCDTNPIYDTLTLYALEHADHVLRTITPDVKGYEFQKAQLAWLGNSDTFHTHAHIRIANPIYDYAPIAAATALFEGFDYKLPWAKEIADRMIAGELLLRLDSTPAKAFESQIQSLCNQLIQQEENEK